MFVCVCVYRWVEAKEDAEASIALDPAFAKGYFRLGTHFTCFNGTKVQILTQKAISGDAMCGAALALASAAHAPLASAAYQACDVGGKDEDAKGAKRRRFIEGGEKKKICTRPFASSGEMCGEEEGEEEKAAASGGGLDEAKKGVLAMLSQVD